MGVDQLAELALVAAEAARELAEEARTRQMTPGPRGPVGVRGPTGLTGSNGAKGDRGAQGERGLTGAQGFPGRDGSKGPQGDRGPQGERGERGPQGEMGERGLAGRDGLPGPEGIPGIPGIGIIGPKGDPGDGGDRLAWRGEWERAELYQINDLVRCDGSVFIAIAIAQGEEPPHWPWELFVSRGEATKGEQTRVMFAGTPQFISGATAASAVSYANAGYLSLTDVKLALDSLLFVAMTASISGGSNVEIGSSVATVALIWSFNKSISAQTLTGTGTVAPTLAARTQTAAGPYTTDKTFTIQGISTDGSETVSASTTLAFLSKRYYGSSANTSLNDAQIIALGTSALSTTRVGTYSFTPSAQYLWFAWPTSFGTPTFTVNGLLNTAWTKTTQSHTNASGAAVSYDLYRSNFLQNGSVSVVVT